jgi:MHS family proline/betaine transporter-like MFS transporter
VLSSAFGVGLTSWMTAQEMNAWGWRIPFLFGILVGPVGIYIRNHLEDATAPPAAKHDSVVGKVFAEQKLRVMLAIGALAVSTAVNYLIIYMPTYAVKTLNLPPAVGFTATLAAAVAVTILTPIAGTVSDRIGRTTHMIAVGLLILFSVFPAFLLLTRIPVPAVIVLSVLYLAVLKAVYFGPLAALMSELFPPATRATGLGLSYNIGVAVFGGMGPAIMTWLGGFALLGDLAPGYYLTVVCLLSLSALITIRATSANSYAA